jgi:hypothetical protein
VAWGPTGTNAPFPLPAHRTSPRAASKAHQKQGPFPPSALPGFIGTTTPSDSRPARRLSRRWRWCDLRPDGSPPITRNTLPTCCAHYPGGSGRVRLSVASPSCRSLPRNPGGSASTTRLSRPAQAALALRPVGSLGRPRRPLSQGSGPPVTRTNRLPATRSTDNCLGGTYLHWCYAPFGAHRITGFALIRPTFTTFTDLRSRAGLPAACRGRGR